MLREMLSKLTDALSKSPDSNIGKIFVAFNQQYQDVKQTLQRMQEWVDLERAEGKELDMMGAEIDQARGAANDAEYRLLIRSKRARSVSDGTMNAVIRATAETLNCKPSELKFSSAIEFGFGETNALMIEKLPKDYLQAAKLSQSQIIKLIEHVLPGDVRVYLALSTREVVRVSLNTYNFPIPYPICNTFHTESKTGILAAIKSTLIARGYASDVLYPICGTFVTSAIAVEGEQVNVTLAGEYRSNDILYKRAGTIYAGEGDI